MPAPFGPEQADDLAGLACEGDLRQRLPPPVVSRDIDRRPGERNVMRACRAGAHARAIGARSSSAITRSSSAVDALQARFVRLPTAASGRRLRSSATTSFISFSRRAFSFASCAACAFAGDSANQAPIDEDDQRRDQRGVARRVAVRRQAGEVQHQRVAGIQPPAGRHDERLPVGIHLAHVGELRRRHLHVADLLDADEHLRQRRRPLLLQCVDSRRPAAARIRPARPSSPAGTAR